MAKISEFHLSPNELMKELAEEMEMYLEKPDSEFLYDRIKFTTYKTEMEDYSMQDQFTRNQLLYTLQEDINILIQQYLRFGRRVVEKSEEDDNQIISFPKGEMPKGYIHSLHNTIKQNWNSTQ
jgi:hypothetical protein